MSSSHAFLSLLCVPPRAAVFSGVPEKSMSNPVHTKNPKISLGVFLIGFGYNPNATPRFALLNVS